MSRYPSAYGHTPSYRSVASTVYPSALGRDPLDVPVFENTKRLKCLHSMRSHFKSISCFEHFLGIWLTGHTQMYALKSISQLPYSGKPLHP